MTNLILLFYANYDIMILDKLSFITEHHFLTSEFILFKKYILKYIRIYWCYHIFVRIRLILFPCLRSCYKDIDKIGASASVHFILMCLRIKAQRNIAIYLNTPKTVFFYTIVIKFHSYLISYFPPFLLYVTHSDNALHKQG